MYTYVESFYTYTIIEHTRINGDSSCGGRRSSLVTLAQFEDAAHVLDLGEVLRDDRLSAHRTVFFGLQQTANAMTQNRDTRCGRNSARPFCPK